MNHSDYTFETKNRNLSVFLKRVNSFNKVGPHQLSLVDSFYLRSTLSKTFHELEYASMMQI